MSTRFGACVARARLHARLGRPMPTRTVSPWRSSCAAAAAMNSEGSRRRAEGGDSDHVPALRPPPPALALVPIIHTRAHPLIGGQAVRQFCAPLHVLCPISHPVHPLVEISV